MRNISITKLFKFQNKSLSYHVKVDPKTLCTVGFPEKFVKGMFCMQTAEETFYQCKKLLVILFFLRQNKKLQPCVLSMSAFELKKSDPCFALCYFLFITIICVKNKYYVTLCPL